MAALPNKEPIRGSTDDVLNLLEALESNRDTETGPQPQSES